MATSVKRYKLWKEGKGEIPKLQSTIAGMTNPWEGLTRFEQAKNKESSVLKRNQLRNRKKEWRKMSRSSEICGAASRWPKVCIARVPEGEVWKC